MPGAHSSAALERPRCPECRNRMMLARIAPGPEGFDIRTFECAKCDHVLTTHVARERGRRVLPSLELDDYVGKLANNSDPPSV